MATAAKLAPPPAHLSARARRIWRSVVEDYALTGLHHLEVLRLGLEAADRAETARLQIERDGLFVPDRYGSVKAHPAERVAKDAAVICARMFRELSLSEEYVEDVRIPRPDGSRS